MNETTNDFYRIVVESVPLIDVRAPVEFGDGAFPNAVNLPLMNDDERHQVGTCYKKHGQDAAIQLGHTLVSGQVKEQRIEKWETFLSVCPDALVYCFRGGLRSQLSQQWASAATRRSVVRLEGGYKAFRRYLLEQLDRAASAPSPIVLGGRTGVLKTQLLHRLDNQIDLEGLANHRGSTFGSFISPQPTQIDFENALAYALLQHHHAGHSLLVVEDEGRHVGRRYLPNSLVDNFSKGNVVVLTAPFHERVENAVEEYVSSAQTAYSVHFGSEGLGRWHENIREKVLRIRRRLGGEREKRVLDALDAAVANQEKSGQVDMHGEWVEILLREYYDPMYDYQLQQKNKKIVFEGEFDEVLAYIAAVSQNQTEKIAQ